ncbi:hypothetical protein MBLNU459_g7841t1 [Dothideomycetes sp. NU459]
MSDLQRTESYQYPATHVGHLNAQQQKALDSFKELCQQKGYFTPAGANGTASHDDETMLRYLRARKFVPQEAFGQFKDTEDWRKENQLDKLYDTIDIDEYEATRRLYPQWTGRRDRRGIPLYLFEVAHLNTKAVSAYESSTSSKNQSVTSKVPVKMMRLFALYENLCNFVLPLCSQIPDRPYPETPVSQSSNIVDISNVGLKQFWNLKNHMQDASQLATAHYPETLDRIFIIGAPSFFPTVWGWIKRWFDPITVSKIFILSKADMKKTLEQYIDPDNIPKQYGGRLDYKFGELPNIEPIIADTLKWSAPEKVNGKNTIPTGPIRWQRDSSSLDAIAVGSQNGKPRDRKVASIPELKKAGAASSLGPASTQGRGPPDAHMFRTTSGVDTHPRTPPAETVDLNPPPTQYPASDAEISNSSAGGTYLSYRDGPPAQQPQTASSATGNSQIEHPSPSQPGLSTVSADRSGTSNTRFAEQLDTHAHGTLAEGTPEVHDNGAGDKYGVMEPGTVGQAPKEHPVPQPEQPAPSYLDQAKAAAGQALAAVGYGAKSDETPAHAQRAEVPDDPAVDRADDHNVEEYLRAQYKSQAAHDASAANKS